MTYIQILSAIAAGASLLKYKVFLSELKDGELSQNSY
jgi:hypothetical protein